MLDELEQARMNGREIANGIHTARTLAREEGVVLGVRELRTVVEAWRDFGRQLGEGEGGGEGGDGGREGEGGEGKGP